ncbi:hypothetical protein B0T17DRAFT_505247 [Bombardia bombarda]|uniref:C2H2-type domain-containing protein n=1 Tax=Bombardia bombarda TaxID=252184 RepID=A0AA39X7K7_9PEZI|nr:hypothetical protein B0T17DRAFT_505247 [Bombardia bombarda]
MHDLTAGMATPRLSARSPLVARSSSLPASSIAGAAIGSIVGALMLLICLFPFIVRARRRRFNQFDGQDFQAEMGQSLGGPISPHGVPGDDSSHSPKRLLSRDHYVPDPEAGFGSSTINGQYPISNEPVTGNGHDVYQKAASIQEPQQRPSALPPGVTLDQGLPSPISPPLSPASRFDSLVSQSVTDGRLDDKASQGVSAAEQSLPSPDPSRSRYGSMGTVGRDSTRELSLVDSYGSPSRQLTLTGNIMPNGITEEPENFNQASSPHRSFPHLPESIRNLINRRHSAHQRRDSRRSTHGGTDGTRSPSIITNTEAITHIESAPPTFDFEIDPRGEAWSYYNDPYLDQQTDSYIPAPAPAFIPASAPVPSPASSLPTHLSIVPPTDAQPSAPPSPLSPVEQSSIPGDRFAAPMITRPIVEEPDAISPDSDKTNPSKDLPKTFGRQSSQLNKRLIGGPLQRTDSLPPPTIVSDIPSPPLHHDAGPSGNPMDLMMPTNATESAWKVEQDILKIENSPSPPPASAPLTPLPVLEEYPSIKEDLSPEPEPEYQYSPQYSSQFAPQYAPHYPPQIEVQSPSMDNTGMLNIPYGEFIMDNSDSSYSTPPPSSGPSTSNTPDTRLTEPYTASPSPRSDANGPLGTSPRIFACDDCHRVFDQVHKLNHHKRYHDKPHECEHPGCSMRFGTKTHLDRHINDKHKRARKFYCTESGCPYSIGGGKSFPRKDNWRRHIQNKHHKTPQADPIEYTDEVIMGGT